MSDSLQPHGQASLSITISLSSLRLTSIESVMPSSHLILPHGSWAELELLRDTFSHLEVEVESLKKEAEHLGQQEAWVREITVFIINLRELLEICAPGRVVCVAPTLGRSWPE